jgi:16S rRNA (cytosine967-C5)-methyltransferase
MAATAPARAAAFQALGLVTTADLGDTLVRTRDLLGDRRDRALATDLVTGTLRWRGAIDFQLARISGQRLDRLDPEVLDALRLGAYQLLYLDRVPASAIVNDSVNLVKAARLKSAAPFVNAVLRRLERERGALAWPPRDALIEYLSVVHSHPDWLVTRWVKRYGVDAAEAWVRFNNVPPTLTLAANRTRTDRDALAARLTEEGVDTEPTPFAPHGLRVTRGRPLTTAAFRQGFCLVQDEASQLIPEMVAAGAGDCLLDACAAPGGKTVALAAQVGTAGLVVATDVRARRMRALQATLARCAIGNARAVQISRGAPLPFASEAFDAVLVDAPCSGLGTLRRDPDIKWKRSPGDLALFAKAQRDLLQRVARVVRSGGRLVYSTCSSEPEENEAVVTAFLADARDFSVGPLAALDDVAPAVRALATPEGFLRTDPARDGLEAFFAAVLPRIVR